MSKTLTFKNTLYNIIDSGDIGNGWKYVEVIDKKQAFSLPKCLYYKGKSMKNLLSYTDYVNHLDMGKDFINDFVKDIFRECYPGSKNPICKVKESLMVGGSEKEDIKNLKDKETVKDLWEEFDKDFNMIIEGDEVNKLLEDGKNGKIYEVIQIYLKMKREHKNEEYLKNELNNRDSIKNMKPSPEDIDLIIKNLNQIYEELPYQKEELNPKDVKLEETEEKEEENKLPGYLAKLFDISGVGNTDINNNTIVYFNIKNDLDVSDKLLHLNNETLFDEFLYQESGNGDALYKEKLIDLIKKIKIQKNDKYYNLKSKEELKEGDPVFSIIEKLIVRDIIKTQTDFTNKKNDYKKNNDKKNKSHFLNLVSQVLQPNEKNNSRTLFRIENA
jgi:hypothetical protein